MSGPSARARSVRRRWTVTVVVGAGLVVAATFGGIAPSGGTQGTPAATDSGTASDTDSGSPAEVFSTYLGGRFWDEGTDVEVDAAGNTYVAGFTLSSDLPVQDAHQPAFGGLSDAFVVKLAPGGNRVVWSTYLGGKDVDLANSLALDRAGNVYVVGRTASADFPTTRAAVQPEIRGRDCQEEPCHDAFVAKLSTTGRLVYSTFLGGSANEEGLGIAVDRAGGAYVTGNTDSTDFPTRAAVQPASLSTPCEGDLPCPYDVFVTKLSPDGENLRYSTYLGGQATDTSGGIAVDADGSAYVTGTSRSPDFPTVAALQRSVNGLGCGPPPGVACLDAFVTKFAGDGARLVYSTLLGGVANERGISIAVGATGSAVVTGSTQSFDFPTRRPVQPAIDNRSCTAVEPEEQCDDGFVSKLTPSGHRLVYSTFLGGTAEDQGLAVAVDERGNAYVGGRTDSPNFPVQDAAQPAFGGYIDGFASSLGPRGALRWSTFVGGSEADRVGGIAVGKDLLVRLTGRTLSPDFPTVRPIQAALQDEDYDLFVRELR